MKTYHLGYRKLISGVSESGASATYSLNERAALSEEEIEIYRTKAAQLSAEALADAVIHNAATKLFFSLKEDESVAEQSKAA